MDKGFICLSNELPMIPEKMVLNEKLSHQLQKARFLHTLKCEICSCRDATDLKVSKCEFTIVVFQICGGEVLTLSYI